MKSFKAEETDRLNTTMHRVEHRVHKLKQDAGAELALDEKAIEYQRKHPDVNYGAALQAAMAENPGLASEYVASFGEHKLSKEQARTFGMGDEGDADAHDSPDTAGKEIDRLALDMQRTNPGWSYEKCMQRVLEERPDLKKRYAGIR